MITVKGFLNVHDFVNNTQDATSAVGELPEIAYSFNDEVLQVPSLDKTVTFVVLNNTGLGSVTENDFLQTLQEVSNAVAELPNAYPGNSSVESETQTALSAHSVSQVAVSPFTTNHNGQNYPNWITFEVDDGSGGEYLFKVWLVGTNLLETYTDFEMVVLPPAIGLVNLDRFHNDAVALRTEIQNQSIASHMNRIVAESRTTPCTFIHSLNLRVYNPNDNSEFYDTSWTCFIRGSEQAIDASDILNALTDVILSNSLEDLQSWLDVIPGLVPMNRYYVIPKWDNIAVANQNGNLKLQSPTIKEADFSAIMTDYFSTDPLPTAQADLLRYTTALYRSVGMFIMPHHENIDGRIAFDDKLSDYMVLDINNPYINLLSGTTQSFITRLDRLLRQADFAVDASDLTDSEVEWVTEGNLDFVSLPTIGIEILVLTRNSYGQ